MHQTVAEHPASSSRQDLLQSLFFLQDISREYTEPSGSVGIREDGTASENEVTMLLGAPKLASKDPTWRVGLVRMYTMPFAQQRGIT